MIERLLPIVRRQVEAEERREQQVTADRIRSLRSERRRLEDALRQSAKGYLERCYTEEDYEAIRARTHQELRAVEWLLGGTNRRTDRSDQAQLLAQLTAAPKVRAAGDVVEQRELLDALLKRVVLTPEPELELSDQCQALLNHQTAVRTTTRETKQEDEPS